MNRSYVIAKESYVVKEENAHIPVARVVYIPFLTWQNPTMQSKGSVFQERKVN